MSPPLDQPWRRSEKAVHQILKTEADLNNFEKNMDRYIFQLSAYRFGPTSAKAMIGREADNRTSRIARTSFGQSDSAKGG